MGILHTLPQTGVFPSVPDNREPVDNIPLHQSDWENYRSAEAEPEVVEALLDEMEQHDWMTSYDNYSELKAALQGWEPVFSKLGLVSKQREDGSWKHRLI